METSDPVSEILLVEDDPAHAVIIRRHLAQMSSRAHVTHVEDGEAALHHLFDRRPDEGTRTPADLMILDLRLPKVDGLEVLRRVKSDPALRRMPVVALTTSSSESDVSKAYDLCVNGYVVKPVSFGQFAQVLRGVSEFWVATNRYPPRRDQL